MSRRKLYRLVRVISFGAIIIYFFSLYYLFIFKKKERSIREDSLKVPRFFSIKKLLKVTVVVLLQLWEEILGFHNPCF